MKIILIILFCVASIFSENFKDASSLKIAYRLLGVEISESINVEVFRILSGFYDEISSLPIKKEREKEIYAKIFFVDPLLDTKFLIQNGFILLYIPQKSSSKIDFDKYKRVKNIFDFLIENKIKAYVTEKNLDFMESFIDAYNSDKYFKGVMISDISFENVLYPYAAVNASSNFKVVLPSGNSELYWEKIISDVPENFLLIKNLQTLSDFIAKKSQIKPDLVQRTVSANSGLLIKDNKKSGSLAKVKARNRLISLFSREYPPKTQAKDIIRSVENIPYKTGVSREIKNKMVKELKTFGGVEIKNIEAVYLNPVRVKTLDKVISIFKINRDLKNININKIIFNGNLTRPSTKYDEKQNSYVLNLSDFATQNNIYEVLKKVPLN